MGHKLQPVQRPGPTYHKSQMSCPDRIHNSRHCLGAFLGPLHSVSKKAEQTLRFLDRNIKVHDKDLKSTFVRPQLEYGSTVWSPHTATIIQNLKLYSAGQPAGLPVTTSTPLL